MPETVTGAAAGPARVAILGASGYTGAELLRLLADHPGVRITALTADRRAGERVAEVFPHLAGLKVPDLVALEAVDWGDVDLVFCALPHATTQSVIAALPHRLRIVDLSADFRLRDPAVYADWYGHAHQAPHLQPQAVYGLTEVYRAGIAPARLVANPGCYPTAAVLPLVPLLKAGVASADRLVIDAKSGVSGAGRAAKEASLFCEVAEGVHAYGVGRHRHVPEIEQALSDAAGREVIVGFTPHLVPVNRGMLATIYADLAGGATPEDVHAVLARAYADEAFVRVLPFGGVPQTRHVRASNLCLIGVVADRVPGRVILLSVIDNLVKGASGQAIQNMNLMLGWPETTGLAAQPVFP